MSTTTTETRAVANFPLFKGAGGGDLCVAYGSHAFAANPSVNDVINLCKLPKGAIILGGWMRAGKMDTNGSPTLDIDIGTSATTALLINAGPENGAAVTNELPEGGVLLPFQGSLTGGPIVLTADTTIQALVNAVAATFAAGTLTVVVFYVTP